MKPEIDFVSYLDRHFATADWRTQDIWFQVRKRLKAEESARKKEEDTLEPMTELFKD